MDKLSNRLKNIVSNPKKTPSEEIDVSDISEQPAVAKFKAHSDPLGQTYDPHLIKEFIENIDEEYYSSTLDTARQEIDRYAKSRDVEGLRRRMAQLIKLNQAVSKRVSELVLEKHPRYQVELERVIELQRTNCDALVQCQQAREDLKVAEDGLARSRLIVVANNRRCIKLHEVLRCLRRIQTLRQSVVALNELIQKENFSGAIELHRECQLVVEDYRQYLCIKKLRAKLQTMKVNIDEGLDGVLLRTCENFDKKVYTTLQRAFSLQGNTQATVNQLQMHYTTAIHRRASRIVLGYVELCSPSNGRQSDHASKPYPDLCKLLTKECFIPCVIDLCKGLWVILRCYHQTALWHREEAAREAQSLKGQQHAVHAEDGLPNKLTETLQLNNSLKPSSRNSSVQSSPTSHRAQLGSSNRAGGSESSSWNDYILSKLEANRVRMWADVLHKVAPLLDGEHMVGFKFEEIIRVLAVIRRLVQIGKEFAAQSSDDLQEVVRKQILMFFRSFHHMHLERLWMFLENEGWELCPVKSTFTILDLIEFRPFRGVLSAKTFGTNHLKDGIQSAVTMEEDSESLASDVQGSAGSAGYFEAYSSTDANPFDFPVDDNCVEDIMEEDVVGGSHMDHDSDGSDKEEAPRGAPGARHDSTSSGQMGRRQGGPLLANTTMEVFRLMGRYMQMTRLLRPIAAEVMYGMCQLFDYYFYAVYHFFANDKLDAVQRSFTSRVRTSLKRIADNLIAGENDTVNQQERVPAPRLSPMIPLTSQDTLFALPCRIVAVESLTQLADVLHATLTPYLRRLIAEEKRGFLTYFCEQTLPSAMLDLRQPAYQATAARCVEYERLPVMMANVNWGSREMGVKWSVYVDELVKMLKLFSSRLEEVSNQVPLPAATETLLWSLVLQNTSTSLVDGYAIPSSCSPEGRSLMLLDFHQYIAQAEHLTSIRPIPGRDIVEDFIRAFYIPVHELEAWLRDHQGRYSKKQLTNLINCTVRERKTKQRLLQTLPSSTSPQHD